MSGEAMDVTCETVDEIDEALTYAIAARKAARDSKKHLVDKFIDDLLDSRAELKKC